MLLSNAPAKSDSTNGNRMGGISFLTTDNWLKSLKYGILSDLNWFLCENATNFPDYSPESRELRTDWSKTIVVQIRGKFVCEKRELTAARLDQKGIFRAQLLFSCQLQ